MPKMFLPGQTPNHAYVGKTYTNDVLDAAKITRQSAAEAANILTDEITYALSMLAIITRGMQVTSPTYRVLHMIEEDLAAVVQEKGFR